MTQQAVLRSMRSEDLPRIEDMVRRTWHYDDMLSPDNARRMGRIDAANCMSRRTFMRVADVDGDIAGIVVANDIKQHRKDRRARMRRWVTALPLIGSREGRDMLNLMHNYLSTDAALSKQTKAMGCEYEGELVLFIVDSAFRGKGIGKQLFRAAMEYFRSVGVDRFFLYTDTGCDYGFYDHHGLNQRCAQSFDWSLGTDTKRITMFIYDDTVSRLLE